MSKTQPCYERDFLTLVVLRVDYPPLPVVEGVVDTPFTAAIEDRFPHVTAMPVKEMTVNVTETGGDVQHIDRGMQFTYRQEVDSTLAVTLGSEFLSIEFGPADYKGFRDLHRQFTDLLHSLHDKLGVQEFSRIGLRYVNEIRLPGRATDWEGIISPELISSVYTRPITGGRMQRSMHQLCELYDETQLILNFGLPNPDYPSVLVQRHFVIDIDCSRSGSISTSEALGSITEMNALAGRAFEASIGDRLREEMGAHK